MRDLNQVLMLAPSSTSTVPLWTSGMANRMLNGASRYCMTMTRQVFRYTALATGIFYGFLHRRTLQATADQHKAEHEAKQYDSWVEQAKQAYAKKQEEGQGLLGKLKSQAKSALGDGA